MLGLLLVALVAGVPTAYYRASYMHSKRFRIVTDGKFYRSGEFTANGLRQIIANYGIKTVINLQHENTDPLLPNLWMGKPKFRESDLCLENGVRYIQLDAFQLISPSEQGQKRPESIDQFLALCDDPSIYPVLIHCKAGLHRTGRFTAIYRMEYEGKSHEAAMYEMKANGYGDFMCTDVDEYFTQYVRDYVKGIRNPAPPPQADLKPQQAAAAPQPKPAQAATPATKNAHSEAGAKR
ncbi:MAG: tyrosine-protein phosphatase [Gemmataceae bacterium]